MAKAVRIVLGIGTILCYVAFLFMFLSIFIFIAGIIGMASDGPRSEPGPAFIFGFVIFYLAIIFVALLSSGLTMGYSFHMAWNEAISPKARGWWTVGLWLGSIFVMPFYWFKHLMKDNEEPAESYPPTPPMSRQNAIMLGILTVVPFVLLALGIVFFALFFSIAMVDLDSPRASGGAVAGALALMALAYVILFVAIIASSAVIYVYGYINAANSRVEPTYRGVWAIGMLLMPYFVIPAYWFLEIWQPATQRSLPAPATNLSKDEDTDSSSPFGTAAAGTAGVATARDVTPLAPVDAEMQAEPVAPVVPGDEATGVMEPAPPADTVSDAATEARGPENPYSDDPPTVAASSFGTPTTPVTPERFPADPGEPAAPTITPERFPPDPGEPTAAASERGQAIPLPPAQPPATPDSPTTPESDSPTNPNQPPSLNK